MGKLLLLATGLVIGLWLVLPPAPVEIAVRPPGDANAAARAQGAAADELATLLPCRPGPPDAPVRRTPAAPTGTDPAPPLAAPPPRLAELEVLDATGHPIADVEVDVCQRRMGGTYSHHCGSSTGRTDAAGRLRFTVFDRADHGCLILRPPPGFAPPEDILVMALFSGEQPATQSPPAEPAPRQRVVLERSAPIEGQVLDPSGAPVVGGSVRATWQRGQRTVKLEAACDVEGRFSLAVPRSAGEVVLRASVEPPFAGPAPFLPPGLRTPKPSPHSAARLAPTWRHGLLPGTRQVVLCLPHAHRLAVRVFFGERARTRRGTFRVTPLDDRHGPPRERRFGRHEDGLFAVDDLPAGAYTVALLFDKELPPVQTEVYVPSAEVLISTP